MLNDTSIIAFIPGLFVLTILLVIYFVPTWIAHKRKHNNFNAILVVNIFLGSTGIGWVGALVWAVINDKNAVR